LIDYDKISKWLEIYFQEYISENISLTYLGDSYILSSSDSLKKIYISSIFHEYYSLGSTFNLGYLDVRVEHYNPSIGGRIPIPSIKGSTIIIHRGNDDNGNIVNISFDLFGVIYWVLNRLEEYDDVDLDEHGRFKHSNLHSSKYDYFDRPIIDEITDLLSFLLFGYSISSTCCSNVILSHDIDRPYLFYKKGFLKFLRTILGDLLKRKSFYLFISTLHNWLRVVVFGKIGDPNFNFKKIVQFSNNFQLKGCFYLIMDFVNKRYDSRYDVYSKEFIDSMSYVLESQHTIGLHPSYNSSISLEQLKKEITNFKKFSLHLGQENLNISVRMHYLRIRIPHTIDQLSNLGVSIDSSMGFSDVIGFRCGTCRPYRMINHFSGNIMNVKISPLLVMDNAVQKIINDDGYYSLMRRLTRVLRNAHVMGGDLTILWHNDSYNDYRLMNVLGELIKKYNHNKTKCH
jgi:hypothetical protein